jgi:hypothetical protein
MNEEFRIGAETKKERLDDRCGSMVIDCCIVGTIFAGLL